MLEISTSLGNTSISVYEKEGVVCPPNLKLNLFTTAAIDNLDINTTSATATSSFHGTAASLNQHVRNEQTGQERTLPKFLETDGKLKQLPQFYDDIKPLYLPDNVPIVSGANLTTNSEESDNLSAQFEKEKMWLDHVAQSKDKSAISWAAYHSMQIEKQ